MAGVELAGENLETLQRSLLAYDDAHLDDPITPPPRPRSRAKGVCPFAAFLA